MLNSINLDDQSYESIMDYIMSELPRLCPDWTDYNEHDPGITILELFAWYKEMQQYHLNVVTDAIISKLLLLLGMKQLPETPARAIAELPESCPPLPKLSRLRAPEDLAFELEAAYNAPVKLRGVYAEDGDGTRSDLAAYFNQPNISAAPFAFGGVDTSLVLILENVTGDTINLYFEIEDRCAVPRNTFAAPAQVPRDIDWSADGVTLTLEKDETHALSQSGFIRFTPPAKTQTLCVKLTLRYSGCEEEVRLRSVSATKVPVVQRRTYSYYDGDTRLVYDSGGLPCLEVPLPAVEGEVIANELEILVRSDSGEYERWDFTPDIFSAAPGAKVFTLDAKRENLVFGDGEYGAVVPKGGDAIIIAAFPISHLERGNIPAGTLTIEATGQSAANEAARGGCKAETVRETARRLALRLRNTNKCASAEDFRRAALSTPGLRVASAEVRVGYDPDAPTGGSAYPVVTVNVLPANVNGTGLADARFLAAVYRHLNAKRPIGVAVRVM
ncbi:MAG: baseplate J/gp47 family protein [Oscillospiraceae bacterium]|jgi:hypothetical protein|nr:baseplate J/gp47 family protein [Oscillospiraceae bacterium]